MRRNIFVLTLLVALVAFNGVAYPWGSTGGDGADARQLQETAVFFNNSGTTMSTGNVAVLDLDGSAVASGTTLGAYVDLIATADVASAVGIVKSTSSLDQTPVVVITKGPALAQSNDASDAVTAGSLVGTTAAQGKMGGGTLLGIALDSGNATDGQLIWIWVDPDNSSS